MIAIADQYLRRIDPFAHKEGMPLVCDTPTEQLRSLVLEPNKLLQFLRQKGLKPMFDPPPQAIPQSRLILPMKIGNREEALTSPNLVIKLAVGKVRKLNGKERSEQLNEKFNQYIRSVVPESSITMFAHFKDLSLDNQFRCIFQEGSFIEQFRDKYPFLDGEYEAPQSPATQQDIPNPTNATSEPVLHSSSPYNPQNITWQNQYTPRQPTSGRGRGNQGRGGGRGSQGRGYLGRGRGQGQRQAPGQPNNYQIPQSPNDPPFTAIKFSQQTQSVEQGFERMYKITARRRGNNFTERPDSQPGIIELI